MAFPESFSTTGDSPFENSVSTLTVKLSASQSGTPTVASTSRSIVFAPDTEGRSRARSRADTAVTSPYSQTRKSFSRMSQSGSNRIVNSESFSSIAMQGRRKSKSASVATVTERRPQTTILEASTSWFSKTRSLLGFGEDSDEEEDDLPEEEKQAFALTRESVYNSLKQILGFTGDVALEFLILGMENMEYVPIPGLQVLAKSFLIIWGAVRKLSMYRRSLLSLAKRCSDILVSISEEINRDSTSATELAGPISKLEMTFKEIEGLVTAQLEANFLSRYLKREETARTIGKCNDSLLQSLSMFTNSVQIRTYQASRASIQTIAQNQDEIMAKLDQIMTAQHLSPPTQTSREARRASAPAELDGLSTFESRRSLAASTSNQAISHSTNDLHEQPPPPRAPVVPALQEITNMQKTYDARADSDDLERKMRDILKQGNDAAFFTFLGIEPSQMPEAIRTLQRILESRELNQTRAQRRLLHREFVETGIEALRRLSVGQNFVTDLPVWTITAYEIDKGKKIGMGTFSEVFKGTWNGRAVAIKQLSPVTSYDLFIREIKVWKALSHPNVLKLYGASSATANPPWFFVSPFMENQTLVQFLKRLSRRDLSDSEILELGSIAEDLPLSRNRTTYGNMPYRLLKVLDVYRILQEIAKGMEYLHCKGILHGDLKAANVLVDKQFRCVISDFGQSEMKSEVYRITGTSVSENGTLRWKAPELFEHSGMLTLSTDVYAYAIVCIEVLSMGDLPWGAMEDDDVRSALLDFNERPVIPADFTSPLLHEIIKTSWVRDPEQRPPFSLTVARLARLRRIAGDGSDILFEDQLPPTSPPTSSACFSPPIASPTPTPNPDSHPTLFDPEDYVALPSPGEVDALRMEDTVPYGRMKHSETAHYLSNVQARLSQINVGDNGVGTLWDSDSDIARTVDSRCQSPPPLNDALAEARNERRYRYLLEHEFNASLTLPLWNPSPVQIGDVGYLSKPAGTFVTLFNAFKAHKLPDTPHGSLSPMSDYGTVIKGNLRMDKRNVAQKGLDAFSGFLTFNRPRNELPIARRQSFRLHAGHSCAHIYTEAAEYHYIKNVELPKVWFTANVGTILHTYGHAHNIQREDLFLGTFIPNFETLRLKSTGISVFSALQASNYALFVSHRHPEGQAHFNVFAGTKKGHPWGTFSTVTKVPGGQIGPSYEDSNPDDHEHAFKISNVNDPSKAILLGRLRFKPDSLEPTSGK